MLEFDSIFVTVGSTSFNALIEELFSDKVLRLLKSKGCRKITAQTGKGYPIDGGRVLDEYNINVEQYNFKTTGFQNDIRDAGLVIGHAGAGTCLDILESRKPAVVVVNESLMGNHQWELARHLNRLGYIKCCTVDSLANTLKNLRPKGFQSYNSASNKMEFVKFFDNLLRTIETD